MAPLNVGNLKKLRSEITERINTLRRAANQAFTDSEISSTEFQKLRNGWGDLETQELKLQGAIDTLAIDFLLDTNSSSPRSRILQATDRLESAIRDIDNIGNILNRVAEVIGIVGDVLAAIGSGGILSFP